MNQSQSGPWYRSGHLSPTQKKNFISPLQEDNINRCDQLSGDTSSETILLKFKSDKHLLDDDAWKKKK